MNSRDFFQVTVTALNGDRACVVCATARDADRVFREYVRQLEKARGVIGWDAHRCVGFRHVDFDGGGTVRFVSSSHQMDGAIWDHECIDDSVFDALDRKFLRMEQSMLTEKLLRWMAPKERSRRVL